MRPVRNERIVYFLMTMTALFWSGAFIAGKIGVEQIPPFSLAFFRFLIAAVVVFVIMLAFRLKYFEVSRKDLGTIIVLGLIGMFGYHVLFFISLKYTSAINDSMICATSPLITSILASGFMGEYFGMQRFKAIMLAFFGVLLAISNGDLEVIRNITFNVGDLIMLGAVLCQASFSVFSKKLTGRYSPLIIIFYTLLVSIIALIPFVIRENPQIYLPNTDWRGWLSVLYMAVFASGIGALFQIISINYVGASRTMVFLNLVPIFSIIMSVFILHEEITLLKIVSAIIIITGVYLHSVIKVRPKI